MKEVPTYFCFVGFAFLLVKAYLHLQYDRQRRKTGSLFLRWIFGAYAFSIIFPIVSMPNSEKEQKLKRVANIAVSLFYLFFVLTCVMVYAVYGS